MRQLQYTVKLQLPLGSKSVSENFKMPAGFVKSMVAYTNGNEKAKPQTIMLALKDDSSVDIIPFIHIDHFRQTGGEYEKSFKPLNFDSENRNFNLAMTSTFQGENDDFADAIVWVTFLMDTNVR
ncbi:hypothetical protein [Flavobacterium sp.]|uniref:hypothetical protein n=1 Tax=Flavobacterium sp. TaxID=239 RepID=UPI0037531823